MDYKNCSSCNQIILDESVQALGKSFHPACFKCHHCHRAIQGTSFISHEGNAYHDECQPTEHKVRQAPSGSCSKCHGAFTEGSVVRAEGNSYHQKCFTCTTCKQAIQGGQFYKSKRGDLLCAGCRNTAD